MKKLFIFIGSLLLFFSLSIPKTYATLPCLIETDPWFTTKLTVVQSALPKGIAIVAYDIHSINELDGESLVNKNSEPFYILGGNPSHIQKFPGSQLPDGYEPKYKIASNKAYYYQNDVGNITTPTPSDYYIFDYGRVGVLKSYLLDADAVGDENVYADDRPSNAQIPQPQSVTIRAYYKGKYLEIPTILHYYLNEKYDPHAGANSCGHGSFFSNNRKVSISLLGNVSGRSLYILPITIFFIAVLVSMLSLVLIGLCGLIISRIQKHSQAVIRWPRYVLLFVLLGITICFVLFDYILLYGTAAIIMVIIMGSIQVYTLFKLNRYIQDWSKILSNKKYKPSITWKKLFIRGLLGTAATFILFFIVASVLASLINR